MDIGSLQQRIIISLALPLEEFHTGILMVLYQLYKPTDIPANKAKVCITAAIALTGKLNASNYSVRCVLPHRSLTTVNVLFSHNCS